MNQSDELFAVQRLGQTGGNYGLRGRSLTREVPQSHNAKSGQVLPGRGSGSGGSSFGETNAYHVAGGAIGEKQVFYDLLNAPLGGMRDGAKLGLPRVQSAEGVTKRVF